MREGSAQRKATLAEWSSEGKIKRTFSFSMITSRRGYKRMTDASGYQIQALDALGPVNSSLGGRRSIVGRPTAIIAAALWPSSTSRFTAVQVGCCFSKYYQ